jgi:hydroxyacylglutathione hydrolase
MREYPDYLQLWPGHGAGSACGKSLGAMPSTTLGYERLVSWAFQAEDEDVFVQAVLAGQPEPPRYFGRMKLLNRDGPPPFPESGPKQIEISALEQLVATPGTAVVDARGSGVFAKGFIPGTINIPAGRSFVTWAGSLIDPDKEVALIVAGEAQAQELGRQLALVGIDRIAGWAGSDVVEQWQAQRRPFECVRLVDAPTLASLPEATIIDVRGKSEWDAGHIPGAQHLFLGDLADGARSLPRDRPLVVACQGGTRASIGVSLLRALGFSNVLNFSGGFTEWCSAGLPIETASASPATG